MKERCPNMSAPNVSDDTIPSSAFTAYELARHRISSCKSLPFGERNLLNGIPGLGGDDGRVTACYIILWKLTLVDFTFLGAKIYRELLLQTCITFIFFIGKDTFHRACLPHRPAAGRGDFQFH